MRSRPIRCLALAVATASVGAGARATCDVSAMLSALRDTRPAVMARYWKQRESLAALSEPPAAAKLVILWGKTDPLVHDQLRTSIAAHRGTGEVYVISSGGYGGVWDVFGPFGRIAARPICGPAPATSAAAGS
jgi:hypothetical protein